VKYVIEIEQASDGGWSGMIDRMPGLLLMGKTIEALLASIPDAVHIYLEDINTKDTSRMGFLRTALRHWSSGRRRSSDPG
jgi:predicted RNase H-like HicB family nuclease